MRHLVYLLILSVFFVGCNSLPVADKALDSRAKKFQANPNGAVLYVYRNEILGGAVRMDVLVDNQLLGETRTGHFMWIDLQPGDYTVMSRAENSDEIGLKVEAGKVYYIWQEAKWGLWYARTKLNVVNEVEGQKGVNECSLLAHRQLMIHPQK